MVSTRSLSSRCSLTGLGFALAALACAPLGCRGGQPLDEPSSSAEGESRPPVGFIRAEGATLVDDEGPIFLRGAAFGNNVWQGSPSPPAFHHDARDFERLRAMGMNATRFYLNYQLFESDAQPYSYRQEGFDWLDQNIAWAKEQGVVLILNMHLPQGGFQSNGEGAALWEDAESRERLIALWVAIAEHVADEPTVAGFDLINEPRPTASREQWVELATAATAAIREVDDRHLIVVERTLSVGDDFGVDADQNFFLLPDDNVLYEFHFYSPFAYTHQYADWLGMGEGGVYPDASRVSSANATWADWNHSPAPPPYLPPGDSEWAEFESEPYAIPEGMALVGPALISELNAGRAYFDELVIREYDEAGEFVRVVVEDPLDSDDGWYFWSADGGGASAVATTGCHAGSCLVIEGTTDDANLGHGGMRFAPKPGHRYSVGGWMKGEDVSDESKPSPHGDWTQESRALFRLDYFEVEGEVLVRDRAALAAELDGIVAWGAANAVPLYLGEFGLIHHCFADGRGGLAWVADMLALSLERELSFTYHSYHEWNFPIFQGDPTQKLPADADAVPGLREVFAEALLP